MANKDRPKGLWPISHPSGEIRVFPYTLTTGQTVYKGDLLKVVAAGTVEESDTDDGVIVIGVASQYADDSASAGGVEVMVWDDPAIVFGIQSDSGTDTTAADIFATANHVGTDGDSTTLQSKHELDASDIGTGGQLEILGLIDRIDNAWGEHSDLKVRIAEHKRNAAVAGV